MDVQKLTILLLSVVVVGCSAGSSLLVRDLESSAPQQGQVISCGGYKAWEDCIHSAAKTCPAGYDVLAKEENLVTQGRTMRISCK